MDAYDTINYIADEETAWNEDSRLRMACRFIDETSGSDTFDGWLRTQAKEEEELLASVRDPDRKAKIQCAIDDFSKRLVDLQQQNPKENYRMLLHVWSGLDFNEFFGVDGDPGQTEANIASSIELYKKQAAMEDDSRLYIEIDHEGYTVEEACVLAYNGGEEDY